MSSRLPAAAADAASPRTREEAKGRAVGIGTAHLANAPINLIALREFARRELVKILESVRDKRKALVLDRALIGPLGLVAEMELLRQHGVDQIYHLVPTELDTDISEIVYLVRPTIKQVKTVAAQILAEKKNSHGAKKNYYVYFVPRRTMLCERILAEEGVFGDVKTGEFHLDLVPFDEDVLTLEMNSAFKECFLEGDPTKLYYAAAALMKIQSVFGIIPNVKGKGNNAWRVYQLMQRMRKETPALVNSNVVPEIDTIILIDRNVDMVTPLLTPMTYEALLDEVFGLKNTIIEVDYEMLNEKKEGKKKMPLNCADTIFKEIRDQNFKALGPYLRTKAEAISETYEERHKTQTVREMHSFMEKFKTANKEHMSLMMHTNLAEGVSVSIKSKAWDQKVDVERNLVETVDVDECENYIDAAIAKQDDLTKIYRLLALLSITTGIKPKKYDQLKRDILLSYGFEQMLTINNLERLGLFTKQVRRSPWPTIRKALRLTLEEKDKEKADYVNPKDLHFVFSGYAPLSVRLVELAHRPGWKRYEEVLSLLPGKTFEAVQELPSSVQDRARSSAAASTHAAPAGRPETKDPLSSPPAAASPTASSSGSGGKPLTLVFFIGGVTHSEISALRFLEDREGHGRSYLVATTKLTNGSALLDSVREKVTNNLRRSTVRG